MGRWANLAASWTALSCACYAHAPPPDSTSDRGDVRPGLIRPMTGHYTITRGGRRIGEERFTITSSASVWRAEGEVTLEAPAESVHGYVLEIDEEAAEPLFFEVWFELYGARRQAVGRRGDDGFFDVVTSGIGGRREKKVPYAAGTSIAFDSPIFQTLALSMLTPSLEVRRPVSVRTIVLPMPDLEASVLLSTYELYERAADGVSHVIMSRPRTDLPVAMWVRDDGLPVRVRTFVSSRGDPVERVLSSSPPMR